jgi:hypothetical protein
LRLHGRFAGGDSLKNLYAKNKRRSILCGVLLRFVFALCLLRQRFKDEVRAKRKLVIVHKNIKWVDSTADMYYTEN